MGSSGLSSLDSLPDARMYALQVHPALSTSCGTANCHGHPGPLAILPSSTGFSPDAEVTTPQDLVEPFRSSYYSVLYHCDLNHPDESAVIIWATDEQSTHPGGKALSDQDLDLLLKWIRSGGAR